MHSQSDHFNDFSPAGIASIDANGMIIQANKRFESLFGYDRDELTGQHLHILLPEQIRTRHEGLFASMSLSGQGRALNNAKPLQCISKTGQKLHILIGLRPVNLSGEQAEPNGWLVHVVDVTELAESTNRMKVLLEETLSRKETIKDMLDKRESMLRALSHELRTPLSICETLLNGEQPDSGQPTLTRHVLSNIHDRLTALVDVSRYWLGQGQDSVRSSGQAKDIVMRQIESVSQLAQVNPALFELITCDQVERPLVMDWVKLDAIVRRALAIALRVGVYSPGGIRVSLNLHPRGLHNARLQLTVEVDHHELHDHYFDESLHPIDIDQALIHEHTRAMHGHCEFNNSNGLLRRFCFECEAEMTKTDTACVAVRSWKDLTVLLVEDEPLVRKLHTLQLEKWGATVHSLANGQQALEHLRNTSTQYDLVLMDLHMPVKNGFDCTREMKSEFAERCRTIVALTAGGTREDQDRAFECGVDGFFLKPLKKDDLATMTASVV